MTAKELAMNMICRGYTVVHAIETANLFNQMWYYEELYQKAFEQYLFQNLHDRSTEAEIREVIRQGKAEGEKAREAAMERVRATS